MAAVKHGCAPPAVRTCAWSRLQCWCGSSSSCAQSLSRARLPVTPWPVALQAPLPLGFSRQEYWSGCHFLLQGIFPTQGSNLVSCVSYIAGGFFLTKATWEASSEQGTQIRRPPAPRIQLGSVASDSPVSCPFTPAGPHGRQCPLSWFPRTWRLGLRKSSSWLLCSWYKSSFLLYRHSDTLRGSARVFFFFFPNQGKKRKDFYLSSLVPSQWEWKFLWSLKFGGYCPITYRNCHKDCISLPSTHALGAPNVVPVLVPGKRATPPLCKRLPCKPWCAKEAEWGIRAAVKGAAPGELILKDEGPIRCSGQKGTSWDSWRRSPRLSLGSRNANPPGAKSGCFSGPPPWLSWPWILWSGPRCPSRCDWQRLSDVGARPSSLPCSSFAGVSCRSRLGAGWPLLVSLFLFAFPKDSSAHAAESTRQTPSLCCILVGRTTFLSKREIKAQDILGAGC